MRMHSRPYDILNNIFAYERQNGQPHRVARKGIAHGKAGDRTAVLQNINDI